MNLPRTLALLAVAALSFAAAPTHAAVTVECSFIGGGDDISRGFYVDNYPGTSLRTVTLSHAAATAGERTITLTVRLATYDGTFLGIASVTRDITTGMAKTVFDFGNIAVAPGSRITFQQALIAGAGGVVFDTGIGPCPAVTETDDTAPPLSTFRRQSVGVIVTGDPASIASALILSCPFNPTTGGDRIDRGIIVHDYQGVTLNTVAVRHNTDTPGAFTISLVARLGAYDGPLLGVATVTRAIGSDFSVTVFDFHDVPVPAGSTITFEQVQNAGTGEVFFDTGFGPCENVVVTFGTSPPLDVERRGSAGLSITGRVAADEPVVVVEYFHAGFGHYFITADPDEIAGLDAGAYGGAFARTGQQFYARNGPVSGTADVCRFFTTAFAPKSSHFYTADPVECAGVKQNPNWQYEKIAFYIPVPAGGACDAGLIPVYRMYNDGMGGAPNHRFVTSVAIYNTFTTTQGWVGEGVRFCAVAP